MATMATVPTEVNTRNSDGWRAGIIFQVNPFVPTSILELIKILLTKLNFPLGESRFEDLIHKAGLDVSPNYYWLDPVRAAIELGKTLGVEIDKSLEFNIEIAWECLANDGLKPEHSSIFPGRELRAIKRKYPKIGVISEYRPKAIDYLLLWTLGYEGKNQLLSAIESKPENLIGEDDIGTLLRTVSNLELVPENYNQRGRLIVISEDEAGVKATQSLILQNKPLDIFNFVLLSPEEAEKQGLWRKRGCQVFTSPSDLFEFLGVKKEW